MEQIASAPAALVERAVAEGRIRELERTPGHTTEVLALSLRHHVLTSQTTMLVGAGPPSTRAIPVVTPRGVEMQERGAGPAPSVPPVLLSGDTDGDGIPDSLDKCPLEPETVNGFEDEDGCPDAGRVEVTTCGVLIIPKIYFPVGSAEVMPEALVIADRLAEILLQHPEYLVVATFGHTDGREANALELSTRRANAVREVLLQRGVDPKVLVPKGLAARYSEDPADTDDARAKNRRVELRILLTTDGETNVEPHDEIVLRGEHGKIAPRSAPHTGELAEVMALLPKQPDAAVQAAEAWTRQMPTELLAWIALGRALDAKGDVAEAARAYGSVLELRPTAEQLRAVGAFLESLAPRHPRALDLAVDAYRRAFALRPDQLASHRHLAWALAQQGHVPNALQILEAGMTHFSVRLQRDIDLLEGKGPKTAILTWESEGSDLDLVAYDADDKPAFATPDVKTGFGPESLSLEKKPARLEVRSQGRGNGYPIGKIMIVTPGKAPVIETRPFVIMMPFSKVVP